MYQKWARLTFVLALCLPVAACGHSTPHPAGADPADLEAEGLQGLVSPKLLRCPSVPLPNGVDSNERIYRVGLRFLVLEDGTVDGATLTQVRSPGSSPDVPASALEEARSLAQGCLFSPATRNGVPTVATVFRIFRVLARGKVQAATDP